MLHSFALTANFSTADHIDSHPVMSCQALTTTAQITKVRKGYDIVLASSLSTVQPNTKLIGLPLENKSCILGSS